MANETSQNERKQLEEDIERIKSALQSSGNDWQLHLDPGVGDSDSDEEGFVELDAQSRVNTGLLSPSQIKQSSSPRKRSRKKARDAQLVEIGDDEEEDDQLVIYEDDEGPEDPTSVTFDVDQMDTPVVQMALALNKAYQDIIMENLESIRDMLSKNREQQAELQHQLTEDMADRLNKGSTVGHRKRVVSSFGMPYFREYKHGFPAPSNEETKLRITNQEISGFLRPPKALKPTERNILKEAVAEDLLKYRLRPLVNRKELELEKLERAKSMEEEEEINGRIEELKHRINVIKVTSKNMEVSEAEKDQIDWMKISTVDFDGQRSTDELKLHWLHVVQSGINTGRWTKVEDSDLTEISERHRARDWAAISSELGTNRTAFQCMQRFHMKLNPCLQTGKWTAEEDKFLKDIIENLTEGGHTPWDQVSYYMEGRSHEQCENRWKTISVEFKRGRWTTEEDELLIASFQRFGNNWRKVQEMVPNRNSQQCRERYVNTLLKTRRVGHWTYEEDKQLWHTVTEIGEGRWAAVSNHVKGRTDNACLQRYNVLWRYHRCEEMVKQMPGGQAVVDRIMESERPDHRDSSRRFTNDLRSLNQTISKLRLQEAQYQKLCDLKYYSSGTVGAQRERELNTKIIKLRIERTQYERARDELVDKRNNEQKEEKEEDEFERMGSREDRQLAYNDRQNGIFIPRPMFGRRGMPESLFKANNEGKLKQALQTRIRNLKLGALPKKKPNSVEKKKAEATPKPKPRARIATKVKLETIRQPGSPHQSSDVQEQDIDENGELSPGSSHADLTVLKDIQQEGTQPPPRKKAKKSGGKKTKKPLSDDEDEDIQEPSESGSLNADRDVSKPAPKKQPMKQTKPAKPKPTRKLVHCKRIKVKSEVESLTCLSTRQDSSKQDVENVQVEMEIYSLLEASESFRPSGRPKRCYATGPECNLMQSQLESKVIKLMSTAMNMDIAGCAKNASTIMSSNSRVAPEIVVDTWSLGECLGGELLQRLRSGELEQKAPEPSKKKAKPTSKGSQRASSQSKSSQGSSEQLPSSQGAPEQNEQDSETPSGQVSQEPTSVQERTEEGSQGLDSQSSKLPNEPSSPKPRESSTKKPDQQDPSVQKAKASSNKDGAAKGTSKDKLKLQSMPRRALHGNAGQAAYTLPPLPPTAATLKAFKALLLDRRNLITQERHKRTADRRAEINAEKQRKAEKARKEAEKPTKSGQVCTSKTSSDSSVNTEQTLASTSAINSPLPAANTPSSSSINSPVIKILPEPTPSPADLNSTSSNNVASTSSHSNTSVSKPSNGTTAASENNQGSDDTAATKSVPDCNKNTDDTNASKPTIDISKKTEEASMSKSKNKAPPTKPNVIVLKGSKLSPAALAEALKARGITVSVDQLRKQILSKQALAQRIDKAEVKPYKGPSNQSQLQMRKSMTATLQATHDFQLLMARFRSLFMWPALLSTIQVDPERYELEKKPLIMGQRQRDNYKASKKDKSHRNRYPCSMGTRFRKVTNKPREEKLATVDKYINMNIRRSVRLSTEGNDSTQLAEENPIPEEESTSASHSQHPSEVKDAIQLSPEREDMKHIPPVVEDNTLLPEDASRDPQLMPCVDEQEPSEEDEHMDLGGMSNEGHPPMEGSTPFEVETVEEHRPKMNPSFIKTEFVSDDENN